MKYLIFVFTTFNIVTAVAKLISDNIDCRDVYSHVRGGWKRTHEPIVNALSSLNNLRKYTNPYLIQLLKYCE